MSSQDQFTRILNSLMKSLSSGLHPYWLFEFISGTRDATNHIASSLLRRLMTRLTVGSVHFIRGQKRIVVIENFTSASFRADDRVSIPARIIYTRARRDTHTCTFKHEPIYPATPGDKSREMQREKRTTRWSDRTLTWTSE